MEGLAPPKVHQALQHAIDLCREARTATAPGMCSADAALLIRFLGKLALAIEAFAQAARFQGGGDPLDYDLLLQVLGDSVEAIHSVQDSVLFVATMSRLQALMQAEEARAAFKAASKDLHAAVAGLAQLRAALPADAAEDLQAAQRQLGAIRFDSSAAEAQLGGQLVHALTVLHSGGGDAGAGALLDAALCRSGLDPHAPAPWLDAELRQLAAAATAARRAGDAVTDFCAVQAAMCVLARASGAWDQCVRADPAHGTAACSGISTFTADVASVLDLNAMDTADGVAASAWRMLASWFAVDLGAVPAGLSARLALSQGTLQQVVACLAPPPPSPRPSLDLGANGSCAPLKLFPTSPNGAVSRPAPLQQKSPAPLRLRLKDEPELVRVLAAPPQGTSRLLQYQAATLLSHAAEMGNSTTLARLLDAGAVPALLAALHLGRHQAVRTAAAGALRHLCKEPAARALVAGAHGGLPALVQNCKSSSPAARQAAARAISNVVVANEALKKEVAQCGGLHALVRMLGSEDGVAGREAAAAALSNLAANSEAMQTTMAATTDAVPALVDVLRAGGPSAQQHACRALRNLTGRVASISDQARAAGGLQACCALLSSPPPLRTAAAAALSNMLWGCPLVQAEAVAHEALPLLLSMLGGEPLCREAAAWCIANLAGVEGCQALVTREFHEPLVELLRLPEPAGRHAAARAIKALSAGFSPRTKLSLKAAGVVQPLVALLGCGHDPSRRAAASALSNCTFRCDEMRGEVVAAGAVPALVALLRPGAASEATQQEAVRALSNLSNYNNYGQAAEIVRCDAIPLLAALLGCGRPPAQEAAASALSNVACLRGSQRKILDAGALPPLLGMLQRDAPPASRATAAHLLSNLLATGEGLTQALAAAAVPAVELLVDLCRTAGPEGQVAGARALGNFAVAHVFGTEAAQGNEGEAGPGADSGMLPPPCSSRTGSGVADLVVQAAAAPVLVTLMQSPHDGVRDAAVHALLDVCVGGAAAGRRAVAEAGAAPWLSQLLLISGDAAKEAAASCLGELACCGPQECEEIRESGALMHLRHLATAGDPEVGAAAAQALRLVETCARPGSPAACDLLSRDSSRMLSRASSRARWSLHQQEAAE